MPEFINKGIKLHYDIQGEGIPFFFLHGLGGSVQQIQSVYEPIPSVRMITLDQQGHGRSEVNWDNYNFDSLADDLIALADHLDYDRFHLGGISMGAAVSVNLAIRFPQRIFSLFLLRNAWTHLPMSAEVQQMFDVCAEYLAGRDLRGYQRTEEYQFLTKLSSYTSSAFLSYFLDEASLCNYKKFTILPRQSPFSQASNLHTIQAPVVVLFNRNDFVHPYAYGDYYQQYIPNARCFEIPDKAGDATGHKASINRHLKALLTQDTGAKRSEA